MFKLTLPLNQRLNQFVLTSSALQRKYIIKERLLIHVSHIEYIKTYSVVLSCIVILYLYLHFMLDKYITVLPMSVFKSFISLLHKLADTWPIWACKMLAFYFQGKEYLAQISLCLGKEFQMLNCSNLPKFTSDNSLYGVEPCSERHMDTVYYPTIVHN